MLTVRKITLVASMSALICLGAFIKISLPFSLVPITLQTLFVFLSGTLLGGSLGALSQLVYILLGIAGLPVFAGFSSGVGALFGPTGGYLIGFVIASFLIGKIIENLSSLSYFKIFLAILTGLMIIYALGAVQLAFVCHFNAKQAILSGIMPFIPGDLLKAILATYLTKKIQMLHATSLKLPNTSTACCKQKETD